MEQEVWNVIHKIEGACKKDGLNDMTVDELGSLLVDVYYMLAKIVMK